MPQITITSTETSFTAATYTDYTIHFTIPSITGSVWNADILSNSTFSGIAGDMDYMAEIVFDDALAAQMHTVSAGERVSDGLQGLGTYTNRLFSGWNGLDQTPHPFYGVRGSIYDSVVTLAEGGGGVLSLTYRLEDRIFVGSNDGYYLVDRAGASVSGSIDNLKLRIDYSTDVPVDPNLKYCFNNMNSAQFGDIVISARILSFDNYSDNNCFVGVTVYQLASKTPVLDCYCMELEKPKLHSPIGVIFDKHGRAVLRYEDTTGTPIYLESYTFGVGSTYVSGSVSWLNYLGSWIEIPIIQCTDAWTVCSDSWDEGVVFSSCTDNWSTYAATAHVVSGASGRVDLYVSEFDDTLGAISSNVAVSGMGGGEKLTYYNLDGTINYSFIRYGIGGAGICPHHTGVQITTKSGDHTVLRKLSRDFENWEDTSQVKPSIGPNVEVGALTRTNRGLVLMGGPAYISANDGETFIQSSVTVLSDVFANGDRLHSCGTMGWEQIYAPYGLAYYRSRYPAWLIDRYIVSGALIDRAILPRPGSSLYSLDEGVNWSIAPIT